MSPSVRISLKAAKALLESPWQLTGPAREELRRAAEKAGRAKATRASRERPKAAKLRAKRAATSAVYDAVAERAGQVCECGCGRWFRGLHGAQQLDHYEGRARSESVDTCWMLRSDCHARKTANSPSAVWWRSRFLEHCKRYDYREAAARARDAIDAEALVVAAGLATVGGL